MEEADKDWMMIRMVGGWVFLLVLAHPGSPGQTAVKRLLLLLCCWLFTYLHTYFFTCLYFTCQKPVTIFRLQNQIYLPHVQNQC